ncbi:uncharacterized protein LOC142234414 [Haematobia irritans]|uniref:uncharacterized protein LOC142234414 n=1 Tax=Haematobia irritans TaxID=7368 RepID=UPI003F50BB88
MYKLFVLLAAVFAIVAARPGYLDDHHLAYGSPVATTLVHEPAYAHVGSVVKSIPTAVSHQSISQVHSSAHVVQPLVAPVIKSYSAPLLKTYAPVAPVLKAYGSPLDHGYGVSPYIDSAYTTYGTGPILKSYGTYGHNYGYGHGYHGDVL